MTINKKSSLIILPSVIIVLATFLILNSEKTTNDIQNENLSISSITEEQNISKEFNTLPNFNEKTREFVSPDIEGKKILITIPQSWNIESYKDSELGYFLVVLHKSGDYVFKINGYTAHSMICDLGLRGYDNVNYPYIFKYDIYKLLRTEIGEMWVGTGEGGIVYDKKEGDGVVEKKGVVYSLCKEDKYGDWGVQTEYGTMTILAPFNHNKAVVDEMIYSIENLSLLKSSE